MGIDPIKPKRELYDFLVSKKKVSNPSYEAWSATKNTPEAIDKLYGNMVRDKLTTSDPDQFKSKFFEPVPVKKKDGGTSGVPTAPTVASPSEPVRPIEPIQAPTVDGQDVKSLWDQQLAPQQPAKPKKPVFNTTPKFALDDMLMAGAETPQTPSWTFTGDKPVDRVFQFSGTEDIGAEYFRKKVQADPNRFVKQAFQMDENQVSEFSVEARKDYAENMVKQRDQSLTNLDVKKKGFKQRFVEDMKRLEELSTPTGDDGVDQIGAQESKAILDYYKQFAGDPDFQLLSNAEKGLGRAQQEVQEELKKIEERNAPREATKKKAQLYSDIAQKTSFGIGGGLNLTGRWASRTALDKMAEVLSVADMAAPTEGFSPLVALADKINEFGQTTFTAPTKAKQSVFEVAPKNFKESFKGVEIATTKYKGQDVEVVHAGGKPIEIRKNGYLLKTLSEEEAKAYQGLPTQRRTNSTQALLNTVGVAGDMFADIYMGGAYFRALSLTGKAAKYSAMGGIVANIYDQTYRDLRSEGMPQDEAKLAAILTAGGIGSISYFVGPVEKYIGKGMGAYSGSVKKSLAELVSRGGLNPYTASSLFLKNYAKMVTSETAEETLLEPMAEAAVGYAFKQATGDEAYLKDYTAEEFRDNLVYSIPLSLLLGFGAAKAETQNFLGSAYLKTIEDAEKTSAYIAQLVKDGTINADQALKVENNLKAARAQLPLLKENLTPEQREEAARLVFLDAQYAELGKDAPPTAKAHYKALQEEVAKQLGEYYGSYVVTDEDLDVEGDPDQKEAKRKAIVEEIKAKNLSHVEGLGMGQSQAQGTYVSTESSNRYGEGKPVDVEVQNPFLVENDPGLQEMRTQLVEQNIAMFTPEDFVDENGMIPETIPDKITIDNLSASGMQKASELVTKTLKEQGYDSIYFPESNTQEGELVVFDRDGVKFKEALEKIDGATEGAVDGATEGVVANSNQESIQKNKPNETTLTRLSPEEERGRDQSGRINAEATTIAIGVHKAIEGKQGVGNANAYSKTKQLESVAIEKYATENGLMLPTPDGEIQDSGNESDIYVSEDNPAKLIKVNNANNNNSWLELLDGIAIHNSENPSTQYTILGFSKNAEGEFSVVLEQNRIIGKPADFKVVHDHLINEGYELYGEYGDGSYIHKEKGIILEDVKEDNVIQDASGNLHFIDTDYYANTKQKGGDRVVGDIASRPTKETAIPAKETAKEPELSKEQKALRRRRALKENVKNQYKPLMDRAAEIGASNITMTVRAALLAGPMLDPKSIMAELGYKWKSEELNKLFSFWRSKDKGGVSIERLSERIAEETELDQMLVRDEIIRILSEEGSSGRQGIAKALERSLDIADGTYSEEDNYLEVHGEFPQYDDVLPEAQEMETPDDIVDLVVDEFGNPRDPVPFDRLPKDIQDRITAHQMVERFNIDPWDYEFVKELAEKNDLTSFEANFKDSPYYERLQEAYTFINGKAQANSIGATTAAELNQAGETYKSEDPTIEGLETDPTYKSYKEERDAKLNDEIKALKKKIGKSLDDIGNLGFAFNFKSQAQKDLDLAKNGLQLAYLYAQKGINTFTDFVQASGIKATAMWESLWDEAKKMHQLSMSPLFFSDQLNFWEDVRNTMQDSNYALLRMMREAESQGVVISDELNAYMKKELQAGKVKAKADQMNLFLYGRDKGSTGHAKSRAESFFGRLEKDGFNKIDLNMYWTAKHVPERNERGREITKKRAEGKIKDLTAIIAAENLKTSPDQKVINSAKTRIQDIQAGLDPKFAIVDDAAHMTDAEAQQILSQFTPEQQATLDKYVKEFSDKVIKPRAQELLDAGVITKEAADALLTGTRKGFNSRFDYYMPMMVKESALELGEISSGGIKIKFDRSGKGSGGSGIKGMTATSRYSWVQGDIYDGVEMAQVQYMRAIKIAENNNTRKSLHDLVLGLMDRMGGQGAVIKSRAVPTLNSAGELVDTDDHTPHAIQENSVKLFVEGKTVYVYLPPHKAKDKDGNETQERHPIVKIFDQKAGSTPESVKLVMEGSRFVINAMRNLVTTWNIGFGPVNFISDIQDAMQNIGDVKAEYKLDRWKNHVRTRTLWNLRKAFVVLANPNKMRFKDSLPADMKDYDMKDFWQEFVENGGPISWSQYESLPQAVESIQKKMDAFYHGEQVHKVAGRVTANVLGYVNDILENQTRLSVYASLRQGGLSAEQAAQAAKNISLNFEKKGTLGAGINTFYMFANAGIQGTARTAKNLKNIKRTWPMLASRMLWVAAMREIAHYLAATDEEDETAETNFNKVLMDSWKSSNYNIYPNPFDPGNPITVRKPYSMLRLVDVVTESAVDLSHGRITGADYQLRVTTALATMLDPIGGGSTEVTGFLPTVVKLFAEPFWTKTDYTGRELIPFEKEYMPLYNQYKEKERGVMYEISTKITEALAYGTGAVKNEDRSKKRKETYEPTIDINPAQLKYFLSQLAPGLPAEVVKSVAEILDAHKEGRGVDPGQIILLRRFYKQMEKNHNSDVALIYDFINRPKGTLFGLTEGSTQFQKDMVLDALKRTRKTSSKDSYSRMKSKLKEKFPEWNVK